MLTGSPGTPLFNVTGTWVDPGANTPAYIRKYDGPDRSVDTIRLGIRLPPVVIGRWLQLLVIALIPTLRFQVSRQPRDGLPERMPSMLPSDTSAEAAEVQRTRIRELPPLERLRKGCRLSNRGRRMALAAIRRRDPAASDEEVRLRFIELAYGAALAGEVRRHLGKPSL